MSNIQMAFLLTTIAGFSTLLGTFIILFKVKQYKKLICGSLSFAAAVMICISITDLVPESLSMLSLNFNSFYSCLLCFVFIIIGIILSMLIDYYIPNDNLKSKDTKLYKVGIISMFAIIFHNIPEGIATFIATTNNVNLGISLTLAIALHNIPEGIAISIPIYYATKSKLKAFGYTLISALSEPFGAIITYFFLKEFITTNIMGYLFAIIAGIMMQISFCELLPHSKSYNMPKFSKLFFGIGCIFSMVYLIFF